MCLSHWVTETLLMLVSKTQPKVTGKERGSCWCQEYQ
jgi:hypothetical protein